MGAELLIVLERTCLGSLAKRLSIEREAKLLEREREFRARVLQEREPPGAEG